MTLDLGLKIFMTAAFGYIAINTIFRYHFSMDRIQAFVFVLILGVSINYLETDKIREFFLTIGLIVLLYGVLKLVSIKYKRHGYLLLNIYRKQHPEVKYELNKLADLHGINKDNINYNIRKPWLVVIKDTSLKTTSKLIKDLDKIFTEKPKKFTMYNYWFLIGLLTLLVILWRF